MTSLYETHATKLLTRVKQLLSETDWTLVSNTNDVILENKSFPEICAIDCFRANGFVNHQPEDLWNEIWNENERSLKAKDPDISEWKVVELGENYKVYTQVNRMPWPLWFRHACCAQVRMQEDNCYWILIFSVDHEKAPLDTTMYVRPIVHMSVYKFENEGTGSRVSKIGHIDPSGNIPAYVVNMYASKLTKPLLDWKAKY
ncbi:lipid-binding START domain-containing protein [Fadolivirus algeromassiliense]|jgi:hypothetical protein|uniref:Lipid-binding START domain-containing protein n=1 Tax=Fadolivirus FV1/VV64 TaxID=3070911 RepID=A0A7D3V545_9VIRU|nr:lipid-binding START domain-containing protein [Fadolivirus algeromassiliense]QKF93495.1 lipid-binding START domain-containing protein [Fadolivirus FV1/VV64]